ncbi:MAG: YhdP family protein [Pseudomonadota bacterium]
MSETPNNSPGEAPRKKKRGPIALVVGLTVRTIAALVIGLALLVGLFRLALPLAPAYHAQIEGWAGEALGVRVILSELDARWPLLSGPELVFEDAALWSPDGEALLLSAERGSVALDMMELLTNFSVKPGDVRLEGVVIDVEHRSEEGGWQVLGRAVAPNAKRSDQVVLTRPRGAQALPRGRLAIDDATIVVTDDRNDPEAGPTRISGVHLDFAHERGSLFLEGALQAPGEGGEVSFSVEGRELSQAAREGRWQFFLSGNQVDLGAIGATVGLEPTALHGIGSVTMWASRNRGRIEQASLTVDLDDLLLAGEGEHAVQYDRLAGRFNLSAQAQGWALLGRDVELARDGHRWPKSSFSVELDGAGVRAARADYVRVDDLLPLAALALSLDPVERSPLPKQVLAMAPRGELSALRFERETPDGPMVAASFDGLAVTVSDQRPGVSGVSGSLNVRGDEGSLTLDCDALVIEAPSLFRQALPAVVAQGTFSWTGDGAGGRTVTAPDIVLRSNAFDVEGKAELRLPPEGSGDDAPGAGPFLDLQLAMSDADMSEFRRYVPSLVLAPSVGRWLETSMVRGTVPRASIAFTGPVKAFPFDGGEGEFLVRAQIQDVELAYADGFPHAVDLTGVIALDNVRLDAEGFSGSTLGNSVRTLEVGIPDLRVGVLEYRSRTRGTLTALTDFLRASPFSPHVEPLEEVRGRGEVLLDFSLPLRKREDATFFAELDAEEGFIQLAGLPMPLEQLAGTLRYDRDNGLSGEDIRGAVLGGDVGVRLTPLYDQDGRAVTSQLEVSGSFDAAEAVRGILPDADGYLEGTTDYLASLRLPQANEDVRSLVIESDLVGARMALPAPLTKGPDDALPTSVVISHAGDGAASLALSIGQLLRARLDGALAEGVISLERGAVTFGGAAPVLPDVRGIEVSGDIEELDLTGWGTVLARVAGAGPAVASAPVDGAPSPALPPLNALALEISRLRVAGQTLETMSVALRNDDDRWAIDLRSEDVAGAVFMPSPDEGAPFVARFSKLHVPAPPPDAPVLAMETTLQGPEPEPEAVDVSAMAGIELDPRRLPALVLEIDDFAWRQLNLGRVALEVQAVESGVRLPRLTVEGESYRLDGEGEWSARETGDQASSLTLAIASSDLLATLEQLGFAGSMSASAASLDANFRWQGPPGIVLDDRLAGEIAVKIESGQLLNVRPGAGKVFGLMSVAALPRRLELDFRDVFDKGLGFDEISGTFTIADGDAYTDDLQLLGQTADVRISGRTGLVSRDYDQTAVVLANVGSPLPVAGALAGGPVVGAALLIFTELMKEPLKDLSRTEYRITGPWAEPTVQRVALPNSRRDAAPSDADQGPAAPAPSGR